ncbi:hypothetical protein [Spongorhabdus nitratireducens]
MKGHLQSVIVALVLALPVVSQSAVAGPDAEPAKAIPQDELQVLKNESMARIEEDIKRSIPAEIAKLHQLMLDAMPEEQMEQQAVAAEIKQYSEQQL